jgi:hypothetical protein
MLLALPWPFVVRLDGSFKFGCRLPFAAFDSGECGTGERVVGSQGEGELATYLQRVIGVVMLTGFMRGAAPGPSCRYSSPLAAWARLSCHLPRHRASSGGRYRFRICLVGS